MNIVINKYNKIIKNTIILDNIDIKFESGNIYGLCGRNGSGKTMLMRAVCGLIYPTSGEIIIDKKVLHKDISFPESIGILIENPAFLSSYTGFKNLKLLSSMKNNVTDTDITDALISVGLDPSDKRTYRKYSLGMKQKLGIAYAVMGHPDIIILDEPLNALDEEGIKRVKQIMDNEKEKGSIIILACHDRYELELMSDYIIYIENGKIKKISEKGKNNAS